MIKSLLMIALSLTPVLACAQVADTLKSPVRTMRYAQVQAYLTGTAADDMALAGEINHFPMPGKVLNLKKELDLSPIQIKKLTDIEVYMHKRRVQSGQSIVKNERTLDSLFRYHKIDEGSLIFYTNRHGLYQGELKNAILFACFAAQKVLTPQQITRFEALQKAK